MGRRAISAKDAPKIVAGEFKMRYPCTFHQVSGGEWLARHEGSDVGTVESRAASRETAIEKIRGEIRYRLELCPCSGESYQHLEIEIVEL